MVQVTQVAILGTIGAAVAGYFAASSAYGGDRQAILHSCHAASERLGVCAIPVYVLIHTLAIALCFPYAVAFEAGAAFLFGFLKGVLCVFVAKVMGAALAFGIGRALFRNYPSASSFVRDSSYFGVLNRGVARDGWKFVLLARFSPIPSYIINYGLAATDVGFLVDFLLPTIAGGIPMILQNTSLGTLTSAATATGGHRKPASSYILPCMGILSGLLITWRIKKYASLDSISEEEEEEMRKASNGSRPGEPGQRTESSHVSSSGLRSGNSQLHQRGKRGS